MARAFASWFYQAEYDAMQQKDKLTIQVVFTGSDVPSGYDVAYGEIFLSPNIPAAQIVQKITDLILAEALPRGYAVVKQDMAIPVLQQGI